MTEIKPLKSPFIWMLIFASALLLSTSYCGGNFALASIEQPTVSAGASLEFEPVRLPKYVSNLDEKGVEK